MKQALTAILMAGALALGGACSDDGNGGGGGGADLPTTNPDVSSGNDLGGSGNTLQHTMTSSSAHGWSLPATAPAPSAECEAPLADAPGPAYAWMGFEHSGTTYTCNRCPAGRNEWQGTWRAIYEGEGGEFDVDATYPGDDTYRETLQFNGNTFRNVIHGQDLGAAVTAVVEGWFWCGDGAEVTNKATFIVVTKVEPAGAFGFEPGLLYTADILGNDTGDSILYSYYENVVTQSGQPWYGTQPYCRVGIDYGGKPCTDPFAN